MSNNGERVLKYSDLLKKESKKEKPKENELVMTDFEHKPSMFYSPIFVCMHCGNMSRVFMHESGDEHYCRFCGEKLTMTKYALSDDESFLFYYDTKEAQIFRENIFVEYVRDNPRFDCESQNMRYKISSRFLN